MVKANNQMIEVNVIVSQQKTLEIFKVVKRNIEKEIKASEYTVKSCGTKNEGLTVEVSEETGFWKEPSSVSSKPLRWIIQISKGHDGVIADYARNEDGDFFAGSKTLGFINNREGNCVAIIFRVIAAVKKVDKTFTFPDWEWLMVMVFNKSLPAGTSGQTIANFDNEAGTISYANKTYKVAALGIYKTPTDNSNIQLGDEEIISYDEATKAFLQFLDLSGRGEE